MRGRGRQRARSLSSSSSPSPSCDVAPAAQTSAAQTSAAQTSTAHSAHSTRQRRGRPHHRREESWDSAAASDSSLERHEHPCLRMKKAGRTQQSHDEEQQEECESSASSSSSSSLPPSPNVSWPNTSEPSSSPSSSRSRSPSPLAPLPSTTTSSVDITRSTIVSRNVRDEHTRIECLVGYALVTLIFTFMFGSIAIAPLAVYVAWRGITYVPITVLLGYTAWRVLLCPAQPWPSFTRRFSNVFARFPYYKRCELRVMSEWARHLLRRHAHVSEGGACGGSGTCTSSTRTTATTTMTATHENESSSTESPCATPCRLLFALHPHGIACLGWTMNGVINRHFQDLHVTWLGARSLFWLPLFSDLLRWLHVDAISAGTMHELMKRGDNIALLPGGFEEAAVFCHGQHRVYLRHRAGFIKFALRYGYTVIPVYTFGEEQTYWAMQSAYGWRHWLSVHKLPGCVFASSMFPFFVPNRDAELITLVGEPLVLPLIAHPTAAQVREWHDTYVRALERVFRAGIEEERQKRQQDERELKQQGEQKATNDQARERAIELDVW